MVYNKLPLGVVLRLIPIIGASVCLGVPMHFEGAITVKIITGLILLLLAGNLIYFINRTNRSIAYYFEAVKNEDTSIHFPNIPNHPSLNLIHRNLNLINQLIQKIKMELGYKEKFYQALIEHSATGLISFNEDNGEVEIINETARRLLEVEHTISSGLLASRYGDLSGVMKSILPGQTSIVKLRMENDLAFLSIRCSQVRYDNQRLKLISLSNIGQELDEKESESWQKLTSVLTHEIMNSIAPITSLSATLSKLFNENAMRSDKPLSRELIENTANGLAVIEEQGKGLMDFVKNYRSIAKVPKPKIGEIDLSVWCNHLKTLYKQDFKQEDVHFDVTVHPSVTRVYADENQLNQVMINLIKNALEAMVFSNVKELLVSVYRNRYNRIVINVKDTGTGIPANIMENVFIPFYTTKEHGSGIGLSLSKQIIRMHGGSLRLISEEAKGTTCLIELAGE